MKYLPYITTESIRQSFNVYLAFIGRIILFFILYIFILMFPEGATVKMNVGTTSDEVAEVV